MREALQIVEAIDDVAAVAMAPQQDGIRSSTFDVPAEETRTIVGWKPDIFERQAAGRAPVLILPGHRVVDKDLIQDIDGRPRCQLSNQNDHPMPPETI